MRSVPVNCRPPGAPIERPRCATYGRTAAKAACESGLAGVLVGGGVRHPSRSFREHPTLLTRFQRAGVLLVVVARPVAPPPHAAHTAVTARGGTRP
jgi:hypothetical protein